MSPPGLTSLPALAMHDWCVYMLRCCDGSLYTGIAKDVDARFASHSKGRGAAYTRTRRPLAVIFRESGMSRSQALIREAQIKRMPKAAKEQMVLPPPPAE